jgi:hypothetical protein
MSEVDDLLRELDGAIATEGAIRVDSRGGSSKHLVSSVARPLMANAINSRKPAARGGDDVDDLLAMLDGAGSAHSSQPLTARDRAPALRVPLSESSPGTTPTATATKGGSKCSSIFIGPALSAGFECGAPKLGFQKRLVKSCTRFDLKGCWHA